MSKTQKPYQKQLSSPTQKSITKTNKYRKSQPNIVVIWIIALKLKRKKRRDRFG